MRAFAAPIVRLIGAFHEDPRSLSDDDGGSTGCREKFESRLRGGAAFLAQVKIIGLGRQLRQYDCSRWPAVARLFGGQTVHETGPARRLEKAAIPCSARISSILGGLEIMLFTPVENLVDKRYRPGIAQGIRDSATPRPQRFAVRDPAFGAASRGTGPRFSPQSVALRGLRRDGAETIHKTRREPVDLCIQKVAETLEE